MLNAIMNQETNTVQLMDGEKVVYRFASHINFECLMILLSNNKFGSSNKYDQFCFEQMYLICTPDELDFTDVVDQVAYATNLIEKFEIVAASVVR